MKRVAAAFIGFLCVLSLASCSAKKANKIDYHTINSSWECDYFKIGTNSNWHCTDSTDKFLTSVYWDWKNDEEAHYYFMHVFESDLYEKLTQNEASEKWEDTKKNVSDDFKAEYDSYFIEDSFVKNGQAYLVIGTTDEKQRKRIEFYANKVHGIFYYYDDEEDIIKSMLEKAEFYT